MKADVQITLEDDEVFGVLRRLHTVLRKRENPNAEPLVEPIPEEEGEEQETAYEEWSNLLQINATVRCAVSNSFEVRISQRRESTSATMCATHATVSTKSVQKLSSGIVSAAAFLSTNQTSAASSIASVSGARGLTRSPTAMLLSRLTSEPNGLVNAVKS